jgi:acyl-CoA synthetase (AMP-forming)/AMP-acid ligase II
MGPLVWEFPVALMSPLDFLVRPAFWLQTLSKHRAHICPAPQFAYNLCVLKVRDEELEGVDLSELRVLLNGAEPVDLEAVERFEERFAATGLRRGTVMPCYGLAEHALCVSMHRRDNERQSRWLDRDTGTVTLPGEDHVKSALLLASSGPPVEATEVAIVTPEAESDGWEPLGDEELGEVVVRSESVCRGYLTDDGEKPATDDDGWCRTGDLGFVSGGELYVVDRIKDMVIAAGRNIFPHDIEREVRRVDGLRSRVAVFAHRNPELGTEGLVVAAETLEEDPEKLVRCASAIRRRVVEAFDAAPHDVILLPKGRIPLTSSGKVRRHRLQGEYDAGTIDDALYSIRRPTGEAVPA